jgi:hypothetical protein
MGLSKIGVGTFGKTTASAQAILRWFDPGVSRYPSPRDDRALGVVRAHKDSWVELPMSERIALLDEVRRDFESIGDRWVAAEVEAKRVDSSSLGEAEEWGCTVGRHGPSLS